MFTSLIPSLLIVLSMLIPAGFMLVVRFREVSRRKSPLSQNLLRSPGESLRTELNGRMWDFAVYLAFMPVVPLLFYALLLQRALDTDGVVRLSPLIMLVGAVVFGFVFYKSFSAIRRIWKLRLGYEAELAMGQELDQLMRQGAVVFHDVPAEGFNIDHVLVAPNGVFAIETKGRSKPNRNRGLEDARVVYDGRALNFPGWVETKPLAQASRQAIWLSKWLTSAVGEQVAAKAVLAFPGWFVERKNRGDVLLISGREAPSILKAKHVTLSDTLLKRIEHQLEQRCRDVEPSMSKKKRQIAA